MMLQDCSFQLLYGKLYSIASVKNVYLAALTVFELGSIICATAPNSTTFILLVDLTICNALSLVR